MNYVFELKKGQFETFSKPPKMMPKRGGTQIAFLSCFSMAFATFLRAFFTFVEMCKMGPFLRRYQRLFFLGVFGPFLLKK